ncbi:uncharacterized protein LOC119078139 [Bradysia coprophila]|uniref:uncharacterized protein LOC119078139 n=1 Tax=Bradysia coprophila TaxID=38358 RepID=UPI00187DCB05|nr:uncharacterized protein LOC119078139 [Bradysia coprophila]
MTSILIRLYKNIFGSSKCFEKRNIFEAMTPLYYLAKFYGFAPFQINYGTVEGVDYFFVAFNFICYLFFIYVHVAVDSFYHRSEKCVDVVIEVFYCASTCVSFTTLIRMFHNRHKIRKIFEQLNEIDEEFESYGGAVSHGKQFIVLSTFVALYAVMQLLLTLNICYVSREVSGQRLTSFLLNLVAFIYDIGCFLAVLSNYLFSIMAVTSRVVLLNDTIRKFDDMDANMVIRISKIYDRLCDIVEFLNYILSFEVMILLTASFGCHVIAAFIFYKQFSSDYQYSSIDEDVRLDASSYVLSLIWHLYYASISVLVIVSGATLSKQVGVIKIDIPTNDFRVCIVKIVVLST